MIQQLKQTENYRSYHQTDTGDVIMQGNPDGRLIGHGQQVKHFLMQPGYYEVIIRGENNPRYEAGSNSRAYQPQTGNMLSCQRVY